MSNILPFYLVCDESYSMAGESIGAMNSALPDLHQAIGTSPVVCDKTRFAIITFADRAEVLQPLADLSKISQLPELAPSGATSFAAAFRLLRTEIDNDVQSLKSEGHRVFRPAVFFLTDGQPTDKESDWKQELAALTDSSNRNHPNIIAFGIGAGADPGTIAQVGVTRAFMSDTGMSPAAALTEFATALTRSIISSGSGGGDQLTPQMPDQIPGFTALNADEL